MTKKKNRTRWPEQELIFLKAAIVEGVPANDTADKMIRAGFGRSRRAIIIRYSRLRASLQKEAA